MIFKVVMFRSSLTNCILRQYITPDYIYINRNAHGIAIYNGIFKSVFCFPSSRRQNPLKNWFPHSSLSRIFFLRCSLFLPRYNLSNLRLLQKNYDFFFKTKLSVYIDLIKSIESHYKSDNVLGTLIHDFSNLFKNSRWHMLFLVLGKDSHVQNQKRFMTSVMR
jgi:hypothetical protein